MDLENRQISIWGDSILKGVVLDETDGRYHVLRNSCVNQFAELTGTEISNHASFGMTTGKAFERIKRAFARELPDKDDIVVLEYGGNDCDFNWAEVAADPERKHLPKTPIDQFGTLFQSIIDLFKSVRIMPVIMALPPLDPGKYFAWLSRGLNVENLRAWLGDVNRIYRWQEAYNDIVGQLANDNGLRLINVRKDFLVSDNYGSLICADGIHPNESGHASILHSVLSYVRGV
ncbi:MAG: SGNH/GDSL hydrolase family protein [Treponemataceae bacterium]